MDSLLLSSNDLDYEVLESITYNKKLNSLLNLNLNKQTTANCIDYSTISELIEYLKKMKELIGKLDDDRRVSFI